MDTNDWRPCAPSGDPTMDPKDWRTQLPPDSRPRIVNHIVDMLRPHLPSSGDEGLNELIKIAVSFEEKIYSAAISQSDYLGRVSLKMLTMQNKSESAISNPGNNSKARDPVCLMDTNNWRPSAASGEPTMDTTDWRTQLLPDSRQRIVNKIMDTLRPHLPFSGDEGLNELGKIAVRFEEKIYAAAHSQPDYLRRISLKMLTMENKCQSAIPSPGNSSKPPDPSN